LFHNPLDRLSAWLARPLDHRHWPDRETNIPAMRLRDNEIRTDPLPELSGYCLLECRWSAL
jgi:hypothetical protein